MSISSSGMGDWREQREYTHEEREKRVQQRHEFLTERAHWVLSEMNTDRHIVMKHQKPQDADKIPDARERKVTQIIYNKLKLDLSSSTRFMKKQSGFGVPGYPKTKKRIPQI